MAGRILNEDVGQVRERADIVEVIGSHTQLKKAGRIFKGLCPFHQEKTPSFTVDPDKGLYHCFGCGVGGDIFTFLREVEGLTFNEAAERLASRVGMQLRYTKTDEASGGRRTMLTAAEEAASFFHRHLMNGDDGLAGRRYIESRGFSKEDAERWRIGFSPQQNDALYRHLLSKKFASSQIVDAGLARVTDDGQHRDWFRGRLVFPINDISGQVVGFGARALGDEMPKYLNSPDSAIFKKGRILYAMDQARREMTKLATAIVTEGFTDVIALRKVGIENAVATCGTALGEEHLALIKRFCDRAILAFDADAAGSVASERAFGIHSRLGLEVLVAPLPSGKDPADVALEGGAEAVEEIISSAVPLMKFVLEQEISRQRLDTAEGKAKAARSAGVFLSWEPSRVARGAHAFWVARRIGVEESALLREIAEVGDSRGGHSEVARAIRQPGNVRVEREALALILESPRLAEESGLTEEHFSEPKHRLLFQLLMNQVSSSEGWSPAGLMDDLPDSDSRRFAAELALTPPTSPEPKEVFDRLEEFRLVRRIEEVRATLDSVDPCREAARHDALFEELMVLESRRREFDKGR